LASGQTEAEGDPLASDPLVRATSGGIHFFSTHGKFPLLNYLIVINFLDIFQFFHFEQSIEPA